MKTSSHASLKTKLARYTAASTALAAGTSAADAQSVSNFQDPYLVPTSTSVSNASMEGTFGDWTGTFSGAGTGGQSSSNFFAFGSPDITQLYFDFQHSFSFGTTDYSFTTIAAGTGDVSFTVSGASSFSVANGVFIKNGAEVQDILVNDDYTFAVNAGDSFGFKFTTDYAGGTPSRLSLYISGFSAAVPEVANFATWMGAGALGLIGMRTARRRRSQTAANVA